MPFSLTPRWHSDFRFVSTIEILKLFFQNPHIFGFNIVKLKTFWIKFYHRLFWELYYTQKTSSKTVKNQNHQKCTFLGLQSQNDMVFVRNFSSFKKTLFHIPHRYMILVFHKSPRNASLLWRNFNFTIVEITVSSGG